MREFEHPNTDSGWTCPICKTSTDKPVTLIGIVGTKEGNIMQAEQFHVECLKLLEFNYYYKNEGILTAKID